MKPVSDPNLLAQLNGDSGLKPVSDPTVLAQLEDNKSEDGYFSKLKKDLKEDYNKMKALGRGAVEGVLDLARGAKQLIDNPQAAEQIGFAPQGTSEKDIQDMRSAKQAYQELPYIKENPGLAATGEIVGQVGATLPAAGLSIPLRAAQVAKAAPGVIAKIGNALTSNTARIVATGSAQGAGIGALQYDPTGEERLQNILFGAGAGALIPGGIAAAKGAYSVTKSILNRNAIKLAEDAAEQAMQRIKEAKSIGVDQLSAGAVTRNPTLQAKEEILLKGSDSPAAAQLRKSYEDTEKQLYAASQRIIKALKGTPKNKVSAGSELQSTERAIYSNAQSKIGEIYDAAKSAPGGDAVIPKDDILKTHKEILEDFVDPKFSPGINKVITTLQDKEAQLTVGEANNLIKRLNAASRTTTNLESKTAINVLKQKVFDAIDTLADDATNPARELFQAARTARKELGDVFNQKDIVETIRKKKAQYTDYIDPEKVVDRINTAADWDKIEKSLKFKGVDGVVNPEGLAAWDNLRATKLNNFFENATSEVNGQLQLSLNKLTTNYKKIGEPVMKKIIGDDKVFNEFKTLMKVMDYWKNKAPGTVNTSNSANVINRIAERGLGILSGIPLISEAAYMLKKLFQEAADKKWVESNLAIGRGKLPKPTKEKVVTQNPVSKVLPIAAAANMTQPSLPEQENTP
jgi:hypothetical protein